MILCSLSSGSISSCPFLRGDVLFPIQHSLLRLSTGGVLHVASLCVMLPGSPGITGRQAATLILYVLYTDWSRIFRTV